MRYSKRPHRPFVTSRWLLALSALVGAASFPTSGRAQIKSPMERLQDLEDQNAELQKRIEALEEDLAEERAAPDEFRSSDRSDANEALDDAGPGADRADSGGLLTFSDGIFTIGGVELRLGGKFEGGLVVPEKEDDPIVGSTESPDPYFEIDVFRLEPELAFSKRISMRGQLDFEPTKGDVILKELTAEYNLKRPAWWFDAALEVGLDDRYVRPGRRTEYYPLIGNAFWRRESLALWLSATIGDKDGSPEFQGNESLTSDSVVIIRKKSPFDFVRNPGELELFFSVGNGYLLDLEDVSKERSDFNKIVIHDRNFDDLAARELGFGASYRRNFESLGELSVGGFYYNDRLGDNSVEFLQNELTVYQGGVPVAGYGTSSNRDRELYGVQLDYRLRTIDLLGEDSGVRRGDGFRLHAEWLQGWDGDLRRRGWYVQGSYRFSFAAEEDAETGRRSRGLIAHRYLRSLEPIVRYGTLDINTEPVPQLPGLWDRTALHLGLRVEITSEVWLRLEYAFNWEDTGASSTVPGPKSVDNNEFLAQLVLRF